MVPGTGPQAHRIYEPREVLSNLKVPLYKLENPCKNRAMETHASTTIPTHCPSCGSGLYVTRLQCPSCGTEMAGTFTFGRLAQLAEPYASLLELFLRVRGNMKEMERELGLSYPTVRARLEEAL